MDWGGAISAPFSFYFYLEAGWILREKRGRPRKEVSRDRIFTVRLSEEEYDQMRWLADMCNMSLGEYTREAIRVYGNMKKYTI